MKRWSVVVAVVAVAFSLPAWCGDLVFSEDFESGDTSGWWAPARVGETGQKTCFDEDGEVIVCAATGQDGDIQPGVAWPNPRFVDNNDGTVSDMLTGLIWLKDASCSELPGTNSSGKADWTEAFAASVALEDDICDLSDGSVAGDWRLPSYFELKSLVNLEFFMPALSDAAGTAQWSNGDVFSGVPLSGSVWSSTSEARLPYTAWDVEFYYGSGFDSSKTVNNYVWPVRGGQWAPARVGETGQKSCYTEDGTPIPCEETGQDGDYQPGVAWPNPRFVDNNDGTVSDMLTGLIWLKDASCDGLLDTDETGHGPWATALTACATLATGSCGLSDGSVAGDWRLPSILELESLLNLEFHGPALSDASGTAQWSEGDPFSEVIWGDEMSDSYWSSTTGVDISTRAWRMELVNGFGLRNAQKTWDLLIWPVRGGR